MYVILKIEGGIIVKKILWVVLLIILGVLIIVGCSNNEYDYKLQVRESGWSGWAEVDKGASENKTENDINKFDIVLEKEYSTNSGKFVFKITETDDDSITIETDEPYSDNDEGINLRTDKTKFKVYSDKETKLKTPTMDGGYIYYLMLVDSKLQVRESGWSGWAEVDKGASENKTENGITKFDIVLGKKYSADSDKFVFKITEANDSSITIETKEPYSDNENSVDLNTKKKNFKVYFDKETELTTPTMDAGDVYYLMLVK